MRSPTKTVAGFLAGSVGLRIDVDNFTIRMMITFLLSLLSGAIYVLIYRVLLGLDQEWGWLEELMKAVGTSLAAMVLFPLLDRTQIRD
jgi:rod shape-determining protein MreD